MQVSIFVLAMKIVFLVIGKTSERWIEEGMGVFLSVSSTIKTEFHALPDVKGGGKMSPTALKEAEASVYQNYLEPADWVVLLDENGMNTVAVNLRTRFKNGAMRVLSG